MSEINVISREQHLIIDTPTRSVNVVTGEAPAKDLSVGVPVISGATYRGTADTPIGVGGSGYNINMDPVNGLVHMLGNDVELVDAGGGITCELRAKVEGLYQINAYARLDGNACQPGSLLLIRQTHPVGLAIARHTFYPTGYSSVHIGVAAYLLRDAKIAMVGYSTAGSMMISSSAQSSIDPWSPMIGMYRVSTTQLVA